MSDFTFLACNLLNNEILAEVPMLGGSKIGKTLSGTGQVDGSIPLGDPKYQGLDLIQATEPNQTALYVDYGGSIIWGGMNWGRDYESENKQLKLTSIEFMSYFTKRFLTVNSSSLFPVNDVDAARIVRELINWAQAQSHGNMLIQVGGEVTGVLVDFDIKSYEYKNIGEAITELAQQDQGFDVSVDCRYDQFDRPTRYLVIEAPERGRKFEQTGFKFEKPGNLLKYTYPEDGTVQTTVTHGLGKGDGDTMVRTDAEMPILYQQGYPKLEGVASFKDVASPARLDRMTIAQQLLNQLPLNVMTATVARNSDPVFGSYIEGDGVQFTVTDERFPTRTVLKKRIVGWSTQVEAATVDLEVEPSFAI